IILTISKAGYTKFSACPNPNVIIAPLIVDSIITTLAIKLRIQTKTSRFSRISLIGITSKNNNSIQILLSRIVPKNTGFHPCSKMGNKSDKSRSGKLINVMEWPVNITVKKSIPAVKAIPLTLILDPYIDKNKKAATITNVGVAGRNAALIISTTEANDIAAKKKKYINST